MVFFFALLFAPLVSAAETEILPIPNPHMHNAKVSNPNCAVPSLVPSAIITAPLVTQADTLQAVINLNYKVRCNP